MCGSIWRTLRAIARSAGARRLSPCSGCGRVPRPYAERFDALKQFCQTLAHAWHDFDVAGHALEVGHAFLEQRLPELLTNAQSENPNSADSIPYLAALVCNSAFDIALHDAFGQLCERPNLRDVQTPTS